jgi:hypothetical protein
VVPEAVALPVRRWTVLRSGTGPFWYIVTVPEALSYTPRAAPPMETAPPAA